MKKILTIAVVAMSFLACNNDDDNLDPFVGKWYKFAENGIEVSECEQKSTIEILENGTFTSSFYYINNNENCELDGIATGIWKNQGNSVYGTKLSGENNDEYDNAKVTFSNNSFTASQPDSENTTTFKRK
ncbi:MAG: lipocalin family protein [Tenacibaculum sp.]